MHDVLCLCCGNQVGVTGMMKRNETTFEVGVHLFASRIKQLPPRFNDKHMHKFPLPDQRYYSLMDFTRSVLQSRQRISCPVDLKIPGNLPDYFLTH